MEVKAIICIDCKKEVKVKHRKTIRCPLCDKEHKKNYHKSYNKNYKAQGNHKKLNKRNYKRTVLKNAKGEVDQYIKYCRENWFKVEGCLSCICPECLQPEKTDEFLPWEQERFYRNDERIEYEIERSIG